MSTNDQYIHREPLGDARVQFTAISRDGALLTVRGKDHDVTVEDLRAIAKAATEVADWLEGDER